jgi:hypothetical protein
MAPIFENGPSFIPSHYELDNRVILPYVEDKERDVGCVRHGGFSEIWGVRIHPAHQQMLSSQNPLV